MRRQNEEHKIKEAGDDQVSQVSNSAFDSKNVPLNGTPMQVKRTIGGTAKDDTGVAEKKAPNDTPFLTHYKMPESKRKTLGEKKDGKEDESTENAALLKF